MKFDTSYFNPHVSTKSRQGTTTIPFHNISEEALQVARTMDQSQVIIEPVNASEYFYIRLCRLDHLYEQIESGYFRGIPEFCSSNVLFIIILLLLLYLYRILPLNQN